MRRIIPIPKVSNLKKVITTVIADITVITIITALFSFSYGGTAQAAGASLYLAPSTGTYVIGGKFTVAVKVNSGGQVINAAEGAINYDSTLLEVAGISKNGSIFTLWTTEPAASGGSIHFGGGIPRPGYNGSAGHICSITFKAKQAGTAQVRFSNGAVLANDGKGTNILASMGSANFTVSPSVTVPAETKPSAPAAEPEPEYNKPVIASPTHPDQNVWYKNNNVEFKWDLPSSVTGVSYSFDQQPVSDPGPASDGLIGEKSYEQVKDGIWYFHLKYKDSKRWGTIAHYRVMIDMTPPLPFDVKVKQTDIGDWPELNFEAKDETSGIEQYEVIVGSLEEKGHTVNADSHMLKVSGLEVGEHTAIVKAIDKAGNEMYAKITFTIEPIAAPVITGYPSEIKSTDNFYINGTALPDISIDIFIQENNETIGTATTSSDANGNWFYLRNEPLENGRYVAWAEAVNANGIKSGPSNKITFLVTPPIFARIGTLVINYFTVFVSLLFLIILIIILILYMAGLLRRKLKKETVEVEDVLRKNLSALQTEVEEELDKLDKVRSSAAYQKGKTQARQNIKANIDQAEKRILKEIKDVEDILK